MKRYEALAADVAASIRSGALKPGDRLPSVREASRSRNVSPSTVFEAYYRLEAQGLIRSRARSGYYVAPRIRPAVPEPERVRVPEDGASRVEINALVLNILRS